VIGRRDRTGPADAEATAFEALAWIAGDDDRLARFMAETGLSPDDLRQAARLPHLPSAVLDHLMQDEQALLAFAAESGRPPESVARAARALGPPPGEFGG
jgi:hypothetical protein